MGSWARSPAESVSVVNDDNEGGALCYRALDSASFLARDQKLLVYR